MGKCPSNIVQKKLPGKIAQKVAPCIIKLCCNTELLNCIDRGFSFHKVLCSVLQLPKAAGRIPTVMVWKKAAKTKHTQTGPSKHSGAGGRGKEGKEDEFALEENTRKEILRYRHNNREGTRTVLSILINIKLLFIPVMAELKFQQSLL